MRHITNALGRYVDFLILLGEILVLCGAVLYFATDALDAYRTQLQLALFLVMGLLGILQGTRCGRTLWGIVGFLGGAILLVITLLTQTVEIGQPLLTYTPYLLALGTILSLLAILFGKHKA